VKLAWLLRGPDFWTFHVHRCRECRRRFADDEPGSWTDYRYDQYPELCSPYSCKTRRDGSRSHTSPHCRSAGPFCPDCAEQVEAELIRLREAYR
jgi:hypothetical protein